MPRKKYNLKFTRKAYEDLDEIFNYITQTFNNVAAVKNLMDGIEKSILRLKDFPYSCSHVSDDLPKAKGYRKLVVDNYIAFYLVDETEHLIIIMQILYGARKYQGLL